MGDRCYVSMEISKCDWQKADELLAGMKSYQWYDVIDESAPHCITVEIHEANFGYYEEMGELMDAGIPFLAFNSEGGDYSAGLTASAAGQRIEVECNRDGDPCIGVKEDGEVIQCQLEEARRYLRLKKQLGLYLYKGEEQDFSWLEDYVSTDLFTHYNIRHWNNSYI